MKNRYEQIIERIFFKFYQKGDKEVLFTRADIISIAKELNIDLPKNIGDLVYSFRYRSELPSSILKESPKNSEWIIRPAGRSRYKFVVAPIAKIVPAKLLIEIKILDATPGIIEKYALNDEQALLAKLRYNRLVDIFTGLTCYSLQSHMRTTIPSLGQVETDEIYVGVDKNGAHYIITVQAKGGADKIGIVQIEQDLAVCKFKFSGLTARPIAAQFIRQDLICLFEFASANEEIKIINERHYRLVGPEALSADELVKYQQMSGI